MKRENFCEKTTFSNSGDSHTFDPGFRGVVPEVWTISFENIDTGTTGVDLVFLSEAAVVGDSSTGLEFDQSIADVAVNDTMDETFETSHPLCKITVTNANLAVSKALVVTCIAGPRNGGVNSTGIIHRTAGTSGHAGLPA